MMGLNNAHFELLRFSCSFLFKCYYSRQLRNLEKAFGGDVRVCDRTALILDIFNQRAATHEAALQVIYIVVYLVVLISFFPFETVNI